MFALPQKPLHISLTGTYSHCQCLQIARKTYPWICYQLTSIHKLEGRKIWLYPYHRWPVYQDGILRASQGHNRYSRSCRSHYQYSSATPWLAQLNCQQSRLSVHLKVLVIAMLHLRYQAKTFYRFLPSNGWADRKAKQYYESLSPGFYQLRTEWLG